MQRSSLWPARRIVLPLLQLGCLLGLLSSPLQAANPPRNVLMSQYTHTVACGPWDGDFAHVGNIDFFLDGKPIGHLKEAEHRLDLLQVNPKDKIRIALPFNSSVSTPMSSIYRRSKFLATWSKAGASLFFSKMSNVEPAHTLTWTWDGGASSTGGEPDWTKLHVVYDGKDIGRGDAGLKNLGTRSWKKGSYLLFILPPQADATANDPSYPKGLDQMVKYIRAKYGVITQTILPVN